jgi:peptidoglycan DL-endopeptidase CwlO
MPPKKKARSLRALCAAGLAALAVVGPGALSQSNAAPSRAELEAAEDRLMELERDFEIAVEEYNAVRERLEAVQADIGATELVVDRLSKRMSGREENAEALAQEMYKAGPVGGMEAVLSSESLSEMDARLAYIETTEEANNQVFERLASDRSVLEDQLTELEDARAEAAEAKAEMASLREDIEAKVADQEDEIGELRAAVERAQERREAAEEAAEEAAADAAAVSPPSTSGGGGAPAPPSTPPAPNGGAQAAVDAALAQVGDPYVWAAAGPDSFDCSGLTMYAWAQAGVSLPHNSGMQYAATTRVAQADLQPGDLLFFGSPIHHVAMYIGNGQMVEAPYSGASVRVTAAFRSDYVGGGRV